MQNFIAQNYAPIVVSSFLTVVFCFLLRPLAIKTALVDEPTDRKKHHFSTPTTGGLCVLLASTVTVLIFREDLSTDLLSIFIATGFMLGWAY